MADASVGFRRLPLVHVPVEREHTPSQTIFGSSKILFHEERLRQYLRDSTSAAGTAAIVPVTMELDLTNVCSHACPWCVGRRTPNSQGEALFAVGGDGEQIPTERAANYIEQMAAAGVRGLILTGGGEPTIHRDLVPLIIGATRYGLDVGLITHGGLLHRHAVDALVEHCTWVRVSVDAATEQEFAQVHGRDRAEWERVWRNVERLVSARRALTARSSRKGATIGLAFLTGPHNVDSIIPFALRARDCGVDYAQIRPFHRHVTFDATPQLQAARALFDDSVFKVVGSVQKYAVIDDAGEPLPRNYSHCHIAHMASVICANEKMYVCCHLRNQEQHCIGDLRKQSFLEVLQGRQRVDVVNRVDVGRCLPACRGDHVNRQVQEILDGQSQGKAEGPVPAHVNFL